MALPAKLEWDVRTTGSDTNGGAFSVGATGTDYSVQDSPQVTFTDLVIGGTTTQLTSAAFPFSAASVGNVINITSGTGFTTGRYCVSSVAGATATMDRSVGTGGSTGGNGNLGGGMATIAAAVTDSVNYNEIHVKSGTYAFTSVVSFSGAKIRALIGYATSHRDGGTRPLITTSTNSTKLFTSPGNLSPISFANINFSNTAAVRDIGISSGQGIIYATDCIFDGFTVGVSGTTASSSEGLILTNVVIKNCTTAGANMNGANNNAYTMVLDGCKIHDNAIGVTTTGRASIHARGSIFAGNTAEGVYANWAQFGRVSLINCTVAGNGTDGIKFLSGNTRHIVMINNIIYGNGGYGINHTHDTTGGARFSPLSFSHNAYGSNTSGNQSDATMGTGLSPITLTADPFTDAAGRDYSLNNTAGGGAACRAAGSQQS